MADLKPSEVIDLESDDETSSSDPGSSIDGTSGDVKQDLLECLENIKSTGTFASFHPLESWVDPELCLEDDPKPIGHPLSEGDARRIVKASHQAPFGKGSETVVDTSVRNTWELNRDRFNLSNPAWAIYLSHILKTVTDDLGIVSGPGSIRAELYKMLLYEKGAMFKPHTDTEKIPRMFGTLVICLPSKHTGGAVKVKHGKQHKVFRTEDANPSYVCWYSDVEHEVCEVTSGYRWVLTYNLAHRSTLEDTLSAANICSDSRFIAGVLKQWRRAVEYDDTTELQLIHMLDYKYTDASLKLSALKGADLLRARFLQDVCKEAGCRMYLASMERTVTGDCDEGYFDPYDHYGGRGGWSDEEDEDEDDVEDEDEPKARGDCLGAVDYHEIVENEDSSLKLSRIVDMEGWELGRDISVEEDMVIQEEPYEHRNPDKEDFSGFTGNEGVYATHWYRDTVILLLPEGYTIEFLLQPFHGGAESSSSSYYSYYRDDKSEQLEKFVGNMIGRYVNNSRDASLRKDLEEVCCRLLVEPCLLKTSDSVYGLVVKASFVLGKPEFLLKAALRIKKQLPSATFSQIGKLVQSFGFDTMLPGLDAAIDKVSTIHDRYKALKDITGTRGDFEQKLDVKLDKWVTGKLEDILQKAQKAQSVSEEDGNALVGAMIWCKASEGFFESAVSFAKEHVKSTPFIFAFLVHLHAFGRSVLPEDEIVSAFKELLSSMIPLLTLQSSREQEASTKRRCLDQFGSYGLLPPFYGREKVEEPRKAPMNGSNLANLIAICMSMDLQAETSVLLNKIQSEASSVDVRDYKAMLLPFLGQILQVLHQTKLPLSDFRFQHLFLTVLGQYVIRYLGKEPTRPSNWTRSRVNCSCADCSWLNLFLSSPSEKIGRFPLAQKRRGHLHQQLNNTDNTHDTERRGSPYTLVVTKTNKNADLAIGKWREKASEARSAFMQLGERNLKELLGEQYDSITQFKVVRAALMISPSASQLRNAPSTVSTQIPAAPARQLNTLPPTSQNATGQRYTASSRQLPPLPPITQRPTPTWNSPLARPPTLTPISANAQRPSMADVSRRISQGASQIHSISRPPKRKAEDAEVIDLTGDD